MITLKRILVPTDFSLPSQKALRHAIEFAKHYDCEVVLLHVLESAPFPPAFGLEGAPPTPMADQARSWAEQQLAKMAREEVPEKVRHRTLMRQGNPTQEIVHTAIQEDADLIIMATQGRSGLEQILLGSVAEKVVRKAPCAVLIVREKAKEIVAPWGEGGGPTM